MPTMAAAITKATASKPASATTRARSLTRRSRHRLSSGVEAALTADARTSLTCASCYEPLVTRCASAGARYQAALPCGSYQRGGVAVPHIDHSPTARTGHGRPDCGTGCRRRTADAVVSVALIGPDGAGKTTITQAMRDEVM